MNTFTTPKHVALALADEMMTILLLFVGGAFGLWVGWSVLTFFEFFEFFFDLLKYCCYNRVAQKKTQDIDDIEH